LDGWPFYRPIVGRGVVQKKEGAPRPGAAALGQNYLSQIADMGTKPADREKLNRFKDLARPENDGLFWASK